MAHRLYTVFADAWINHNLEDNQAEFEEIQSLLVEELRVLAAIVDTDEERYHLELTDRSARKMLAVYPRWLELVQAGDAQVIRSQDSDLGHPCEEAVRAPAGSRCDPGNQHERDGSCDQPDHQGNRQPECYNPGDYSGNGGNV